MTWILIPDQLCSRFAPGSVRWTSESSSLPEPVLWATSSGTATARPCSWRGWKTRAWSQLPWSRLWKDSTGGSGLAAWTSSLRDSRASRTATPASDRAPPTSEPSGPRSRASSVSASPVRCSSRTSQGLLFDDPSLTFKLWASSCIRHAWRRPRTSVRPTSASDGLCSLPTPLARDHRSGKASEETLERNARPLNEVVQNLPTPTATDSRASGAAGYSTKSGRHSGTTLTDAVLGAASAGRRGQLNPQLSEWMLGLPDGWSACEPLATSELRRWSTLVRSCLSRHTPA